MKVTSGVVTINKDPTTNLIGITIGGGPPHCPCIYVIQVRINCISHLNNLNNKYNNAYIFLNFL